MLILRLKTPLDNERELNVCMNLIPEEIYIGREGSLSVNQQISEDKLSLYQKAADRSGFNMAVIAGPGEEFTFKKTSPDFPFDLKDEEATVKDGYVAVSVTRPADGSKGKNHSLFWKTVKELEAEQETS